jgi:hypothetical protein
MKFFWNKANDANADVEQHREQEASRHVGSDS